jgi:hypothetical protein
MKWMFRACAMAALSTACTADEELATTSAAASVDVGTRAVSLPKPIEASELTKAIDLVPDNCRFLAKIVGQSPDSLPLKPRFMISLVCVKRGNAQIVAQVRGALADYNSTRAAIDIEVEQQAEDFGLADGGMGSPLIVGPKGPGSPKYPDPLAIAEVAVNLSDDSDYYFVASPNSAKPMD